MASAVGNFVSVGFHTKLRGDTVARVSQLESEAERARKMDEEVKGEDLMFKT
jgi:hypothetical protein